jgi:hypothetical protein
METSCIAMVNVCEDDDEVKPTCILGMNAFERIVVLRPAGLIDVRGSESPEALVMVKKCAKRKNSMGAFL